MSLGLNFWKLLPEVFDKDTNGCREMEREIEKGVGNVKRERERLGGGGVLREREGENKYSIKKRI